MVARLCGVMEGLAAGCSLYATSPYSSSICCHAWTVQSQERCLLLLVIVAAGGLVPGRGSIRHGRLCPGLPACKPQQRTRPLHAGQTKPPAVLGSPHGVISSTPVADFPVVPVAPHKEEADEEGVAGGAGELMTSEDAEAAAMDLLGGDLEASSPYHRAWYPPGPEAGRC